jgi:hypothetical protein
MGKAAGSPVPAAFFALNADRPAIPLDRPSNPIARTPIALHIQ